MSASRQQLLSLMQKLSVQEVVSYTRLFNWEDTDDFLQPVSFLKNEGDDPYPTKH